MQPAPGTTFKDFRLYGRASELTPPRDVYCAGSGPPVIVFHELYGASPEDFAFAGRLVDAGFTVFVPVLFGKPNARGLGFFCVAHEFAVLSSCRSSPMAEWGRSLGRLISQDFGGRGIGAIGLCLTGGFALTMMLDPWVLAPVVSEPALPFGLTTSLKSALPLSCEDVSAIRQRIAAGAEILAFRFAGDWISPELRDLTLRSTFDNVRGNGRLKPTCPHAHAVFTTHYRDTPGSSTRAAYDELIAFLNEKLG